jgi:hypothetical protein
MLAGGGGANAAAAWSKGFTNCSDVVIGIIGECMFRANSLFRLCCGQDVHRAAASGWRALAPGTMLQM